MPPSTRRKEARRLQRAIVRRQIEVEKLRIKPPFKKDSLEEPYFFALSEDGFPADLPLSFAESHWPESCCFIL
jgi:hypothetical protein